MLDIHSQEHAPILTGFASVGVEVVAAYVELGEIASDLQGNVKRGRYKLHEGDDEIPVRYPDIISWNLFVGSPLSAHDHTSDKSGT